MDRMNWNVRAALPLVIVTGLLAGQPSIVLADSGGKAGASGATAGRDCGRCHSGATGAATTVKFDGVPATVLANSVNTLTFTVSGGPALATGLGISASAGTLTASDPRTKLLSLTATTPPEVVHTAPTLVTAGASVSYTFRWTAPATAGTVTLYGSGVSSNNDGVELLDGTANAQATITVTAGGTTPTPTPTPTPGPVANVAPTAMITGPTTGVVGTPVAFSGTGSTDPDGTIATYAWDFGDGTAGASATPPAHSYAKPGTFKVKLIVMDNLGLASTAATHDIVISAVGTHTAPVANIGGPYTGTAGTPVSFNGSTSTVDSGLTATYSWDFGDGSALGMGATPTHTYTKPGTFTVKLTVTDNAPTPLHTTVTTTAVIAAGTTPPPTGGTSGELLYADNCESCHGPKAGPPGKAGSVVGESAKDIVEAIIKEPTMRSLSTLKPEEIAAIAVYLKKVSKGEQLYIDN